MSAKKPFLGHAIANGKLRFSSVSQIKTFYAGSDGCPRKWAFQYVFGKKLAKTDALDKGIELAKALEHYLKTAENVLPPVLQPAQKFYPVPGPDLEVEQPLGDIEKALYYRDAYLKFTPAELANAALVDETLARIERFAGLTACGIPLMGAADFRHRRGEFIDEEGVLRPEPTGAVVVETGDQKVISQISSKKILSGPKAGMLIQGWAKTSAQVCEDFQMVGYARAAVGKYPDATHHRLSHVYAQKSSKDAAKRTGLITVAQVLDRWHGVEDVVRQMVQVATAQRIEDVEPNLAACDSFTHLSPDDGKTQLRGCGYKYICPRSAAVFQNMLGQHKESSMSLFDTLDPSVLPAGMQPTITGQTVVSAPPPPPLDPTSERALIEAEKARLRAQDATQVQKLGCGAPGCGENCAPGWVKGAGSGAFLTCPACQGKGGMTIRVEGAPPPPPPTTGVTPPDAPPQAPLLYAAAPLPEAARAEITDPRVLQVVTEHAAEHKKLAEVEAAKSQAAKEMAGTSVWCAESNKSIVLTMDMALARKYTCSCAKVIGLKPEKQADGTFQATLPRHKLAKKEPTVVVAPPPPPPVLEVVPLPPSPSPPAPTNGVNGNHALAELPFKFVPTPDTQLLQSIDGTLKALLAHFQGQPRG